ncbi:MAG: restriction endonuclease subunit S [Chloroflexi bacterium]|nr:restriction endonuclease subunit S [Chloroflexota bacterium]MBU1746197.1 restriction endonuclease subunit S [Chloroflexota bacterium]
MITRLKPYPAYQNSGVPWLGDIPAHWDTERAKWLFQKMKRQVRPDDDIVTCFRDGTVTLRKNRRVSGFTNALKEIGYQGVRRGDLVIHAMDAFAGAVGVSDSNGKCTPVYAVCQPQSDASPHYYAYVVREMARSQWIAALAKGVRERSTDFRFEGFAAQFVPVPPRDEQDCITAFLNYIDRRTRHYIRAQRKLIALLEEQKQAVIQHAVTHGLNANVRLKPSGVEWLGEIPEHWEVRRVRTLVSSIDQGVSPQAEAGLADEESWGVLKAGCVNGGVFREEEHKRLPERFPIDPGIAVKTGDVLVSRACGSPRFVGSVGRVRSLRYRLILSDKTFRLNFAEPRLADFLVLAMNSRYFRIQVEQAISGAEGLANNLPLSSLKNFRVSVPPVTEAVLISEWLTSETKRISELIEATTQQISFLREYRTRLIADVVTGKLDVREAAANLPEVAEEPEAFDEAEALAEGDEVADEVDEELERVEADDEDGYE